MKGDRGERGHDVTRADRTGAAAGSTHPRPGRPMYFVETGDHPRVRADAGRFFEANAGGRGEGCGDNISLSCVIGTLKYFV